MVFRTFFLHGIFTICFICVSCQEEEPVHSVERPEKHIFDTYPIQTILNQHRRVKRQTGTASNVSPLRLHFHYTERVRGLGNFKQMEREVFEKVRTFWQGALKIKNPATEPLTIIRRCIGSVYNLDGENKIFCARGCIAQKTCSGTAIPFQYNQPCRELVNGNVVQTDDGGPGSPNTDTIVVIDMGTDADCVGSRLASGSTCELEYGTDRPILGVIQLCNRATQMGYPETRKTLHIMHHELVHTLGFQSFLYAFMRNESGDPLTPRSPATNLPALGVLSNGLYIPSPNVLDSLTRNWKSVRGTFQYNVTILKTAPLVAAARNHYQCPDLTGVELESRGGQGTAGAHFAKLWVEDELMSPTLSKPGFISVLTLAFLQGTGNLSIKPWCDQVSEPGRQCLIHENAYGRCSLTLHPRAFAPEYQYFTQLTATAVAFYAGNDAYMRYCPYNEGSHPSNQRSSYCLHEENMQYLGRNGEFETTGPTSMCVNHDPSSTWKVYTCAKNYTVPAEYATCHRFYCSPTRGLILYFGDKQIVCPLQGSSIPIDTYDNRRYVIGKIACPSCASKCNNCPSVQPVFNNQLDQLQFIGTCNSVSLIYNLFLSLLSIFLIEFIIHS